MSQIRLDPNIPPTHLTFTDIREMRDTVFTLEGSDKIYVKPVIGGFVIIDPSAAGVSAITSITFEEATSNFISPYSRRNVEKATDLALFAKVTYRKQ